MALDNHTDMDFTPQSPLSSASNVKRERTVSLLRQDKGHHESDTLYQLAWNEYQDVQSSLQQAVSDFDSLPLYQPRLLASCLA
ncbi:hypothetical protein TNCV_182611 [Trichonephila clavipes]|nr:hypothetical protein TNCV_182611 [Trichonephila clavipes]